MKAPVPILWWNSLVLADVGGGVSERLDPNGDAVLGVCRFVEGLDPRPKAVRVFYASPLSEPSPTTCPSGSRSLAVKALSARFPAMADSSVPWAAHPVKEGGPGATTLLYLDPHRRLARLRAALAERGIVLEAAFPVIVLVEAALAEDLEAGPAMVLLHGEEGTAVFWMTRDGDRHAVFFDGATARERTIQELVTGVSVFGDNPAPALIAVELGEKGFEFPAVGPRATRTVGIAEILSKADRVSAKGFGNFLPREPRITSDVLCHAAAVGLLIGAAGLGMNYLGAVREAKADLALRSAQKEELVRENAQLRANKAKIGGIEAVLREAVVARPVKLRFLEALNRARPAQISIRGVTLNEASWALSGYAHEGVGVEKGPYQAFLAALQRNEGWTVGPDSLVPVIKQPEFALQGTIP